MSAIARWQASARSSLDHCQIESPPALHAARHPTLYAKPFDAA